MRSARRIPNQRAAFRTQEADIPVRDARSTTGSAGNRRPCHGPDRCWRPCLFDALSSSFGDVEAGRYSPLPCATRCPAARSRSRRPRVALTSTRSGTTTSALAVPWMCKSPPRHGERLGGNRPKEGVGHHARRLSFLRGLSGINRSPHPDCHDEGDRGDQRLPRVARHRRATALGEG